MAKKAKIKEGVSVEEIENFTRKYMWEVFSALAVIVASISSTFNFFSGAGWSIMLAGLGTLISIIIPTHMDKLFDKFYLFINKQQKPSQIILGIVEIVIALFLPFVIFAFLGLLAGIAWHEHGKYIHTGPTTRRPTKTTTIIEKEEEHL